MSLSTMLYLYNSLRKKFKLCFYRFWAQTRYRSLLQAPRACVLHDLVDYPRDRYRCFLIALQYVRTLTYLNTKYNRADLACHLAAQNVLANLSSTNLRNFISSLNTALHRHCVTPHLAEQQVIGSFSCNSVSFLTTSPPRLITHPSPQTPSY